MPKQSSRVPLVLLPILSAAAIAAGCGSQKTQGWQTCVDTDNRIADEQSCQNEQRRATGTGFVPMYHWYFYPYGGRPYPVGYGIPQGGHHGSAVPFAGIATRTMGVPATGAVAPRAGYGGFGSSSRSVGA